MVRVEKKDVCACAVTLLPCSPSFSVEKDRKVKILKCKLLKQTQNIYELLPCVPSECLLFFVACLPPRAYGQ